MMDEARFRELSEAYGADTRRWPATEREAAEAFRATDPARAGVVLATAAALDDLLWRSRVSAPSAELRARVIALAERAGLRPRRPLLARPSTWMSGAGWAAACAAGMLVGAQATASLAAVLKADSVLYQASLTGLDEQEVLG